MKIYTKTGDDGQTGLYGGGRVRKDHPRIDAYGTVDELNAALGVARAEGLDDDLDQELLRIQNELFDIGAELATPRPEILPHRIGVRHVEALEATVDRLEQELPPLKTFILPGGMKAAGALHLARTVCRRAERRVVHFDEACEFHVSPELIIYLNRLSDLLFVMARAANARAGQGDVAWRKSE